MTTPITQHQDIEASREKLPPVERATLPDAATAAAHPAEATHAAKKQPTYETPGDPNDPPGATAKAVAHWIHQHPEAHKHGAGKLVYQFSRSLVASAPYGVSMAATLAVFEGMSRWGTALAEGAGNAVVRGFGRNLKGFAGFGPAKWGALIASSFTFYRGTSKLGKWMTEYLFNPNDTEKRTAEKVDDLPQEAWRKIKEIAPAESSSTPVAAVVLGFIVSAFQKPYNFVKESFTGGQLVKEQQILVDVGKDAAKHTINADWTRSNFLATQGWKNRLILMGKVLTPKTKFIQQAAINTFGYSLFFELGDRLFKDTQIRRGVWPGEHNSIKALKAAPEDYEQGIKAQQDATTTPKYEDSAVEAAPENKHYAFFTNEPSVGRFMFRRVLPTALGITAYTGMKMRWGTMLGNDFGYKAGESILRKIPKLALTEGLATSLFFLVPIFSEPWEKMYDTFWAKKEKIAQLRDDMKAHPDKYAQGATPRQQANYETLLDRVNAKEKAANESHVAQRA
jgi:hypothetical protein